jgi:flagellar hook assembly protein FlgD
MKAFRQIFFLLSAMLLLVTSQALANVYASNIRVTQQGTLGPFDGRFSDGTGVSIRFVLSDHADSVIVTIKNGSTVVRTLKATTLALGDTSIVWDGKNNAGSYVGSATYTLSLTAYDQGYFSFTELVWVDAAGLSTRGMTTVNNPALKSFGFAFGIDNGGYLATTGISKIAADGEAWGDSKGVAKLTNTGLALGPNEARWGPSADEDGYVYVLGRTAKQVYRFHADTANVVLVDSGYGQYYPFGIAIRNDATTKTVAVVVNNNSGTATLTGDSRILTYKVNSGAVTYFGPKDTLVKGNGTVAYWDVVFGRDSTLYTTFISASGDWPRSGVAKFSLKGKKLPLTMADTAWTVRVDSGRVGTLSMFFGTPTDGSSDVVYFVNARIANGNPPAGQGIYAIYNLNSARPTRYYAYPDKQLNASITRSDVSVDPAGNLVYFENSNEEIAIVSPPDGPNSYTTTVSVPLTVVTEVERTGQIPSNFALEQNYPNPFNPSTMIRFSLPTSARVTLKVYDVVGREVAELVDQELTAGVFNYRFDGNRLAGGTYFCRMTATSTQDGKQQNFSDTKKLILLK